MQLSKEITIKDLALIIKDTLIIADTHIGYEEALNKQGILIPRFAFNEIIQRIERIINNHHFKRIIINGDVKHEFGKISETEWRNTIKLLDFLLKYSNEVILIKGNHDKIIRPIAKKKNVKVESEIILKQNNKNILITHGDIISKRTNKADIIIIGHEHPGVTLSEGAKKETYKCFLKGKYKGKTLIVQPSSNLVTEGTDISKEKLLSPYLKGDISEFEVFIVADKVYDFGKLRNIPA